MDGQFYFGLFCGGIASLGLVTLFIFLITIAFKSDPIRSMRIIIRGGDDVNLELDEKHQVSKQVDEKQIVTRFKKHNYTVDVKFNKVEK